MPDSAPKIRSNSKELARSLGTEFVYPAPERAAAIIRLPVESRPRFEEKATTYSIAILLLALLVAEKENASYGSVIKDFEHLIYPSSPETGEFLMPKVKAAMRDFDCLLVEKKELSWSLAWLQEVGVEVSNPTTLVLFSAHWMDLFIVISKALKQFEPI